MPNTKKELFTEIPFLEGDDLLIKRIEDKDAPLLEELRNNDKVYALEPTFLYERQFEDIHEAIKGMYEGPTFTNQESLILGIYPKATQEFAGIIELYGYRKDIRKISVGYRLLERYWGKGIASKALSMMIRYLYEETHIEIITASTMVDNKASAKVLMKNDFNLVVSAAEEDWGYEKPTLADKWIR